MQQDLRMGRWRHLGVGRDERRMLERSCPRVPIVFLLFLFLFSLEWRGSESRSNGGVKFFVIEHG